jgi:cytochrome c peroxidase
MRRFRGSGVGGSRAMKAGMLTATSMLCLGLLQPSAIAQEAVENPADFIPPAETASTPAAPLANTVTEAETVLPAAKTPDYFEALYPMYMRAPLPAKIYSQGGIPPLVPQLELDKNPFGKLGSYLPNGPVATATHPFFDGKLGSNGRSCATCHQPPSAMSISLRNIKARFKNTKGTDPLFAPVDGANCPTAVPAANTSGSLYGGLRGKGRKALKDAYGLLLNKGLIRIPMPWPPENNPNPEFTIELVKDAFGNCNTDPEFGMPAGFVSVYRRPQMSASLNFKTLRQDGTVGIDGTDKILPGSVMWDGREPSLTSQARSAILGHAQATAEPPADKLEQIEDFQNAFFSAQYSFKAIGRLDAAGATGGPVALSGRGVNLLTPPPTDLAFDEYEAWATQPGLRASIKRGQDLFHTRPFELKDIAGSNLANLVIRPAPGVRIPITVPNPATPSTCSICHATEHAGSDFFENSHRDLGVGGSRTGKVVVGAANALDPANDLPQFKLTCTSGEHPFLGKGPVVVNDPGRALFTGKCEDIGRFIVPQLRGLAAREPYFHDGSAPTIRKVIDFYSARFKYLNPADPVLLDADPTNNAQAAELPLSEQEKVDLVNFLAAL